MDLGEVVECAGWAEGGQPSLRLHVMVGVPQTLGATTTVPYIAVVTSETGP